MSEQTSAVERLIRGEPITADEQPRCKWCGHKVDYGSGRFYHTNLEGFWCWDSTGKRRMPAPEGYTNSGKRADA